jgi:3-phosphoinositide dependent protein kinase-1
VKITDFGTSTIYSEDTNSPRTSFVGTQDYVSPEVLSGDKKATKACDLWALGCMVYQMLSGISPFRGGTEYLTFENIMGHCKGTQPLTFPSVIDRDTQDLILQLLRPDDTERLGAGEDCNSNGYALLKAHEFFHGVEWGELVNKTAPFQPDSSRFPSDKHMRDGASDDWLMEGDPTPIQSSRQSDAGLLSVEVASPTSNSKWEQFLSPPERRVFTGLIYKRKVRHHCGLAAAPYFVPPVLVDSADSFMSVFLPPTHLQGLFSKKRQLILTDAPRLLYVDPDTMEYKGEIPWTREQPVKCVVVSRVLSTVSVR